MPLGGAVVLEAAVAMAGAHILSVTGPELSAADILTLLTSKTGPIRLCRVGPQYQGPGVVSGPALIRAWGCNLAKQHYYSDAL